MIRRVVPLLVLIILSGCVSQTSLDERYRLAESLAQKAGMEDKVISTPFFNLKTYSRLSSPTTSPTHAVVYIEGDGKAWDGRVPSGNPTPINPLALRLAAIDDSENVIYLARPCQYINNTCDTKFWTTHRMAPEVIESYVQALKQINQQYGIQQFRLVGFSGGGGIAVLVSAQVQKMDDIDVIDLRTVAGNLNHMVWTQSQRLAPLSGSMNPADYAHKLSHLPQIHFIGEEDPIITDTLYKSYLKHLRNTRCTQGQIEPAFHVQGWETLWEDLQKIKPSCDL